MNPISKLPIVVLTAAILLCSCHEHRPEDVAIPLPDEFSETGTALPPSEWWESFQDAELNRLARQLLSDSPDLKQAWARLEQARALADQAAASRWPALTGETEAARARSNVPSASGGTQASYANQFSAGLSASYEPDLWGRTAASVEAAELDAEASRDDADALSMSLIAELAETWFGIIEQKALLRLTREQLGVSETFLELTGLRFGHGEASALDVWQQRQQVAAVRARIPPAESRLQVLSHKLAVLLGQPPRTPMAEPPHMLPDLPALPATGLPSEFLTQRPDVRAARLRLAAADQRVAAAIADRFPSFLISASGGFRASEIAELLENTVWSIIGSLSGTLWDGGRKSAEVRRSEAVAKERGAQYVQLALNAFQEVEDALVREKHQHDYIEKLETQTDLARKSLEESRNHYMNGEGSYLNVLTALMSLQQSEQGLVSAKKQLLSYRIQLYRALGRGIQT